MFQYGGEAGKLAILAFPCNQFGAQEPGKSKSEIEMKYLDKGWVAMQWRRMLFLKFHLFSGSNADIKAFAASQGATFDMFAKVPTDVFETKQPWTFKQNQLLTHFSRFLAFWLNLFLLMTKRTFEEKKQCCHDQVCLSVQSTFSTDPNGKVDVNGNNAAPLWKWLKEQEGGLLGSGIKWNFTKFVVDPDGKTVARVGPMSDPIPTVQAEIEKIIGKPGQWEGW